MDICGKQITTLAIIAIVIFVLVNFILGIVGSVFGIRNNPHGKRLAAGVTSVVGIFMPPVGIIGGIMAVSWKDN